MCEILSSHANDDTVLFGRKKGLLPPSANANIEAPGWCPSTAPHGNTSQKTGFSEIRWFVRAGMWHIRDWGEVNAGFGWGSLKEADHLEDLGVDGDDIELNIKEIGWEGVDWIWIRIGDVAGCCEFGNEPFGFHAMRAVCLLVTKEELCVMEVVGCCHWMVTLFVTALVSLWSLGYDAV